MKSNLQSSEAGVTLVEILAAIFIMGTGLMTLLTLFPLGALEMAEAIKDDRTAAIAAEVSAFSEAGEDLLVRTGVFVQSSLSERWADPGAAAKLRQEYQHLASRAADLEAQLQELGRVYPRWKIQRHIRPLLLQIHSIQRRFEPLIRSLSLLEQGQVGL